MKDLGVFEGDLARGGDGDRNSWCIAGASGCVLDLGDNVHALKDSAENNVTTIQPGSLDSGDEELFAISFRTSYSSRIMEGVYSRME